MTREEIEAAVEGALEWLPRDSESVAEVLLEEGCTGFRWDDEGCPIYHYLVKHTKLDEEHEIEVGDGELKVYYKFDGSVSSLVCPETIDLPCHIAEFITLFDDGVFPELDRGVTTEEIT